MGNDTDSLGGPLINGDGAVGDPLTAKQPSILGGDGTLIRAVDGLQFGGRNALLAYRGGVLKAITAPVGARFYTGLSTTFATGALNKLDEDAVIQDRDAGCIPKLVRVPSTLWAMVLVDTGEEATNGLGVAGDRARDRVRTLLANTDMSIKTKS